MDDFMIKTLQLQFRKTKAELTKAQQAEIQKAISDLKKIKAKYSKYSKTELSLIRKSWDWGGKENMKRLEDKEKVKEAKRMLRQKDKEIDAVLKSRKALKALHY